MRVFTTTFRGPQMESDLVDAINAKLLENVSSEDPRREFDNIRNYVTNLVVKLAEKGMLKAIDLEDGLIGHQYSVEDE